MRSLTWIPQAAITAGTPFSPAAAAGASRIVGVVGAVINPALASGAYPTAARIQEAGVASGAGSGTSGAAGAGQITFNIATQQFASGDAIQQYGEVIITVLEDGDVPVNP